MLQVEARRQELIEEFGMTEEELDAIPELRYDESQDELRKYLRLNSQLNDSKMWSPLELIPQSDLLFLS